MDALKAAKFLRGRNKLSEDIVLLVDEMYLEKSCEYDGGIISVQIVMENSIKDLKETFHTLSELVQRLPLMVACSQMR